MTTYKAMLGLTMASVITFGDEMIFTAETGETFKFLHNQDCCESVYIDHQDGELSDLVGSPIVQAEEVSSDDTGFVDPDDRDANWTFYNFATVKGSVQIRWIGISENYSTAVSCYATDSSGANIEPY